MSYIDNMFWNIARLAISYFFQPLEFQICTYILKFISYNVIYVLICGHIWTYLVYLNRYSMYIYLTFLVVLVLAVFYYHMDRKVFNKVLLCKPLTNQTEPKKPTNFLMALMRQRTTIPWCTANDTIKCKFAECKNINIASEWSSLYILVWLCSLQLSDPQRNLIYGNTRNICSYIDFTNIICHI